MAKRRALYKHVRAQLFNSGFSVTTTDSQDFKYAYAYKSNNRRQGRGRGLRNVLGCAELGRRNLKEDAPCHEVLDSFLSKGHKEIDGGILYAEGETERILGRYAPCKDPEMVSLVSKANKGSHPEGLKYNGVIEQLEMSLQNLKVPSVDTFFLHWPDRSTPIEETLSAVQELYTKKKFKEFGVCNYVSWEVAEIYYICKNNGWVLPTVYEGMYNAVTRMVEGELLPCLRHFNIRFYAYNVEHVAKGLISIICFGNESHFQGSYQLGGGILTGNYNFSEPPEKQRTGRFWGRQSVFEERYRDRYWRQSLFTGIEKVKKSLESVYGAGKVSLANAAVRWMVHHSQLDPKYGDGVITGGSSLKHINENLDAFDDGPLDPSIVEAFDEAWQLDKKNCVPYYID